MNVQKLSSIKNSLVESNVQPTSKKISEKKTDAAKQFWRINAIMPIDKGISRQKEEV